MSAPRWVTRWAMDQTIRDEVNRRARACGVDAEAVVAQLIARVLPTMIAEAWCSRLAEAVQSEPSSDPEITPAAAAAGSR